MPPELPRIVEKSAGEETGQQEVTPPAQLASDAEPPVHVSLANAPDGIVVPMETSNPNVSIVWIYPPVRPAVAAGRPDDRVP